MTSTNLSILSLPFQFQFNEPPLTYSWIGFTIVAILLAFIIFKRDPYAHIPAVGGADIISSYLTARKSYSQSRELISEGYAKYKGGLFRVPENDRWNIIVSRPDHIEEVRKAPDHILSFSDFTDAEFFVKELMGPTLTENEYHIDLVRGPLTKNLSLLFDDLREEVVLAMEENIPLTDDWTSVHVFPKMVEVVARASNRIFVGLPVCREPEFLKVNIDYTMDANAGRDILIRLPGFLRPLVSKFLSTVPKSIARASKHLGPIIQERLNLIDEYGSDYPDKPVDYLSWLLDLATGDERRIPRLTNRILHINFAAIHTSSMSFTHALYHLAAEPHYLQPLRDEIETVIEEEGWTKVAMTKMHKLDSFFRESQRYNGISLQQLLVTLSRIALKDFTFSDGTFIPKGSTISAATYSIHRDDEKYPDGEKFDGFRFARIRAQEGQNTSHQFVNTSADYVPFGHGKHACPGRFFAANELKVMMAYLILNYDVKMENEGVRPPNVAAAFACIPDVTANVMFRRRRS